MTLEERFIKAFTRDYGHDERYRMAFDNAECDTVIVTYRDAELPDLVGAVAIIKPPVDIFDHRWSNAMEALQIGIESQRKKAAA